MAAWASDELDKIDKEEEIKLATMKADGALSKPTTIWAVRVGDDLYVRSVHGRKGKWWQHALERHAGHVSVGAVEADVAFEEADPKVYDDVSAAYRAKYGHYSDSVTGTVLSQESRESTLRLV